jgi:hypothetical protein
MSFKQFFVPKFFTVHGLFEVMNSFENLIKVMKIFSKMYVHIKSFSISLRVFFNSYLCSLSNTLALPKDI